MSRHQVKYSKGEHRPALLMEIVEHVFKTRGDIECGEIGKDTNSHSGVTSFSFFLISFSFSVVAIVMQHWISAASRPLRGQAEHNGVRTLIL